MVARAKTLLQPRGHARVSRSAAVVVQGPARAGGEAGRPTPSRDAGPGRLSAFLPRLVRLRRPWDSTLSPDATQGFFRFHGHAFARSRRASLVATEEPTRSRSHGA